MRSTRAARGAGRAARRGRPAVVVNCIGLVKQLEEASRPCQRDRPERALPAPAAAAMRGARRRLPARQHRLRLLRRLAPPGRLHARTTTPDARDLYGLSKLLGEVRAAGPDHPHVDHRLGARARLGAARVVRRPGRQAGVGLRKAIFSGLTTRALADVLEEVAHVAPEPRAGLLPRGRRADRQVRAPDGAARRARTSDCSIRARGRAARSTARSTRARFRAATGIEAAVLGRDARRATDTEELR